LVAMPKWSIIRIFLIGAETSKPSSPSVNIWLSALDGPLDMAEHTTSWPTVGPTSYTLERFWRRVAEITTRYHDSQRQWTGGEEIRLWNLRNRVVSPTKMTYLHII
jgi:hypothetical protein